MIFATSKRRFQKCLNWKSLGDLKAEVIPVLSKNYQLKVRSEILKKNRTFLPRDRWLSKYELWNSGYWLRTCKNFQFCGIGYEVLDERRCWFTHRSPLIFIQIHSSEGAILTQILVSFRENFTSKTENPALLRLLLFRLCYTEIIHMFYWFMGGLTRHCEN